MKIALVQINPTIGDFKHNREKMMAYIERAKGLSCDLVVFSELVISGYPPRDLLEREDFVTANLETLRKLVDSVKGIGVICGFVDRNPRREGKPLHNSVVLFEEGKFCIRRTRDYCLLMMSLTKQGILNQAQNTRPSSIRVAL